MTHQGPPWTDPKYAKDPGPKRRWGVLAELMGECAEWYARTGEVRERVGGPPRAKDTGQSTLFPPGYEPEREEGSR